MTANAINRRDILGSAIWLFIGLLALISSLRLGVGNVGNPGSGFVLFYASILFIGCIVLMLLLTHLKAQGFNSRERWQGLPRRKVIVVIAANILYLLILEKLGYLLATFLLMVLLFGLSRVKLWALITCAASTVGGSYYIFHSLLKVPLPAGLLGF